jgi:hypothetical protein
MPRVYVPPSSLAKDGGRPARSSARASRALQRAVEQANVRPGRHARSAEWSEIRHMRFSSNFSNLRLAPLFDTSSNWCPRSSAVGDKSQAPGPTAADVGLFARSYHHQKISSSRAVVLRTNGRHRFGLRATDCSSSASDGGSAYRDVHDAPASSRR